MKTSKKILSLIGLILICSMFMTGCMKPYNKPKFEEITPSQTAFLIPMTGDTTQQGVFESEELLQESKVASKRVQIPREWVKTGRISWSGKYMDTHQLVIVERKPETREWQNGTDGTSAKNQGVTAESKESIGFTASVNCSAQIDEKNAVKFLYRYNNKTLESIMDTEIRARVESKFVEECSERTLEQIIANKTEIMDSVRNDVVPYFAERGVTITSLGLKGEFTYLDASIQKSMNAKFTAEKELQAQEAINNKNISEAEANKKVIEIQAQTLDAQLELKKLDIMEKMVEKWNGQLSKVGGNSPFILDMNGLE